MTVLGGNTDRACPGNCGRMIPPAKYLCNIDADKAGTTQCVLLGTLWDTGNLVLLAAVIAGLKLNP